MTVDTDSKHVHEPLISYHFEVVRAHLGQFAARMIEEALLAGLPSTWERRAAAFDVVPLPEVAAACRDKAEFLRRYPDVMAETVGVSTMAALFEVGVVSGVAA